MRSRRGAYGVNLYNEAKWNYLKLLEKQEVLWSQRAKQYWLKHGDNNTRFFHRFASTRKEHNKIRRLKDADGNWRDTEEAIQGTIIKYFVRDFLGEQYG